jgi:NADH:ubiquinone oxidoreductase subunit 4 (subunit M)
MIGMLDSVFKIFYQIDVKKLIAYATVAEMHWLVLCMVSGQSPM